MREGFVGVHIGAGQHAESRTQLYLSICSDACREAIKVLRNGGDALEAACRATMVLEELGIDPDDVTVDDFRYNNNRLKIFSA